MPNFRIFSRKTEKEIGRVLNAPIAEDALSLFSPFATPQNVQVLREVVVNKDLSDCWKKGHCICYHWNKSPCCKCGKHPNG